MTVAERPSRIEQMYGPGCMVECINASIARDRAVDLVKASGYSDSHDAANAFFAGQAEQVLACYLLAAALLGEDDKTILRWARNPTDAQPWTALAERPDHVPAGWALRRELIEQMPAHNRAACFAVVLSALRLPAEL